MVTIVHYPPSFVSSLRWRCQCELRYPPITRSTGPGTVLLITTGHRLNFRPYERTHLYSLQRRLFELNCFVRDRSFEQLHLASFSTGGRTNGVPYGRCSWIVQVTLPCLLPETGKNISNDIQGSIILIRIIYPAIKMISFLLRDSRKWNEP